MYGLSIADFVVIAVYLTGITALGIWMSRRVSSLSDFAMPRAFGKVMMVFFSFGTGTNSDQAVAVAGKSFTNGISGIWYSWMNIFVTPFYWIIAPAFRRLRAVTTGDVYEARFGPSLSRLYAFLGFTKLMFSIGVSLKGGAVMVSAVSGGAISGDAAIALLTALFVLYGTAGGLSAAIVTDLVQGVMTIAFSFILLPFVLGAVGGLDGVRAATTDPDFLELFSRTQIGWFYVAMLGVTSILSSLGAPHTMGNCAAGRDEMDGAVGFMVGSLIKRVCTVAWAIVGLAGTVYFMGRDVHPEQVYGLTAREFLPQLGFGALGFFLASLMAGMMSTCDALMVSASALFTQNLYQPFVPNRSQRHYLWVVRGSSIAVVIGAVSIAYLLPGFIAGLEVYWKLSSIIGIALLLGLLWRGITTAGAWAAILGAYGAWLLSTTSGFVSLIERLPFRASWKVVENDSMNLPWQILFYLSVGLIAAIVTSKLTRSVPGEKLDLFYALMRTPIRPGEVIEKSCTMPIGAETPPPRPVFPGTQFEIQVPTARTVWGFSAGVAASVGLVWFVAWLV